MNFSLFWVFIFLLCERSFELILSKKHLKSLMAKGAKEYYPETFYKIALLHAGFLVALAYEAYPWQASLKPVTCIYLGLAVGLQLWRFWCMKSLGEFWNVRIVMLPGASLVQKGPYRFIRHPNYFGVILEFALFPLLMNAPWTFIVFFPMNLLILWQRIRLEESVLYKEKSV